VLLLFYLAPLWTVLFAAAVLGERPGVVGLLVIVLSAAGAVVMLWRPGLHIPIPRSAAEWFGVTAGMTFALTNVLIRKARGLTIQVKSVAVFAGVVAVALAMVPLEGVSLQEPLQAGSEALALLALLGLVIFATNLAVQHGLMEIAANRAIVLLLSELVVASAASYFLAMEALHWNQWVGGTMIVTASLVSARLA
jgi:drug/metabolite transporter (DMT)-like permease